MNHVQRFNEEHAKEIQSLKTSRAGRGRVSATGIRCNALEAFMEVLEDCMIVGHWRNQHDTAALFLATILQQRTVADINKRNLHGTEIDVNGLLGGVELKTASNVTAASLSGLVREYFEDMVLDQDEKPTWWLAFLRKRADRKSINDTRCMYYMIVVAIDTSGLDDGDARQLERDVVRVEQDLENEMIVVDEIAKKGFVSVDNIWVVDRLRERVAEEQKKLAEVREKLAEVREKLAERDELIEQLKRQLGPDR